MLRFILTRETYDGIECHDNNLYTVDCEAPELEKALTSGGYGGGPNGDSFDHSKLIGVEVLRVSDAAVTPKK